MKKFTLIIAAAFITLFASAQSFNALYTFDSVKTTSGTTDPSFVPTATGMNFGSFSATGTPANSLAAARFDFSAWATGSLGGIADTFYSGMTGAADLAEYYQVTINPTGTYYMDLDSIKFSFERSGTGVRTYSVRSSVDGYASNLSAVYIAPNTSVDVQAANTFFLRKDITTPQNRNVILLGSGSFYGITGPVTFRFYGWNSEAASGTFSIDNVRFVGSAGLPLGIAENNLNSISVFPNPSSNGLFTVDLGNTSSKSTLEVFNILGTIIYSKEINGKQNIDLSNQANGSYFVKISNAENSTTKKIIIAK